MEENDQSNPDWMSPSVVQLSHYIEETLSEIFQRAVFVSNDRRLWQQIRLYAESFMHTLFLRGALKGKTAEEAFFVRCDDTTNTQADINSGAVNLLVGFAPLKPAEFVTVKIQLRKRDQISS